MDVDDAIVDRWLGVGEDLADQVSSLAHEQLMEEEVHEPDMGRFAFQGGVMVSSRCQLGLPA